MKRTADIQDELKAISPLLADLEVQAVQEVPDGYFGQLEAAVMARLGAAGLLPATPAHYIPAGYFDSLPGQILSKIEGTAAHELESLSPLLAGIPKTTPFEVPEGYFGSLQDNISQLLPEPALPASWEAARHQSTLTVPEGYFEQLPDALLKKVQTGKPARVIRMGFIRLAAAAVFTGLLALGGYRWMQQPAVIEQPVTVQAALPSFIEEGKQLNDQQFDEKLSTLSEEVIIRYLEKTSAETDVAVLSASLEDETLPDEEAYLTDDNTLNQFIETLSTDN